MSLNQFLSSFCTPGSRWEGSKSPSVRLRDSHSRHAQLSVVTLGIQNSAVPNGSTSISQSLPLLNSFTRMCEARAQK